MNNNDNSVIIVKDYNKIDGYHAYHSEIRGLSLGLEKSDNANEIVVKIEKNRENNDLPESVTLELHQVLDLAVFACRSLEYFQEAYRYPKLYNPISPRIDRIGLQGDAMSLTVNTDNDQIDQDIQELSLALGNSGDIIGERVRLLRQLLNEMEY